LGKGELSKDEYPYVKEPASVIEENSSYSMHPETTFAPKQPHSVRTIRFAWPSKPQQISLDIGRLRLISSLSRRLS
jgi:hypothetical protein